MKNRLLYLGHASIRIITGENKVIYIDPFGGSDYSLDADLVLVTHEHYDHSDLSKIKNSNYTLITHKEALAGNTHNSFDLGYVKIISVEAGYNQFHDKEKCVGYILILSDNTSIYVCGDTSITKQMDELDKYHLDYAFYPCDGYYTMSVEDAIKASEKVKARVNIPYHTKPGEDFVYETAKQFKTAGAFLLEPNKEIELEHI